MMRTASRALAIALLLALGGCGGAQTTEEDTASRSHSMSGAAMPEDDQGRCDTEGSNMEASEYDTSGDDHPNVRRVFRRVGQAPMTRLVLVCREVDLNSDGIKDIVRYYNDEGRPLREEADRNFDGQMDIITYFQDGRIVRQELDRNGNGRVDTKIFYEEGVMTRTERDLAGRSTATEWHPDRWEYFEDGHMVRMGTDADGDGVVDGWDRDQEWNARRQQLPEDEGADDAASEGGEDQDAEQ